jgi:hypothetical protein
MQEIKFDSVSYLAGGWVDAGEHTLPALSVRAWADGKVVFRTGESQSE